MCRKKISFKLLRVEEEKKFLLNSLKPTQNGERREKHDSVNRLVSREENRDSNFSFFYSHSFGLGIHFKSISRFFLEKRRKKV